MFSIPEDPAFIYSAEYFKNEYKADAGYTDYDKDKEPMCPVFEIYLNKLARLTVRRNIFDVGAATGYFLDITKMMDGKHSAARSQHTRLKKQKAADIQWSQEASWV